jgi:Peptidase family M23
MTTPRTTSTARALLALAALLLFLLCAVAFALTSAASAGSPKTGCTGTYGWPVKPFDRAHPIRGSFGDPRTVFTGPRSEQTLLAGDGSFSFHQGLDISAPDGSPVYAIAAGTVTRARGGRVTVDCGNGRSFQYWHIEPIARVGQRAVAGRTLLGFVQPKREHVHLTHLEKRRAVSPLAPGRLTPYRDATSPKVLTVSIDRRAGGLVDFTAEAIDMPALPVPGRWHGFPVTPALLTWRIETSDGRIVVHRRVARDVRQVVPKNNLFWRTFARGAHQNWPVFAGCKEKLMSARYLFVLAARPFDTTTLRDGEYVLVVSAEDAAGNRDIRRMPFGVANGLSGS